MRNLLALLFVLGCGTDNNLSQDLSLPACPGGADTSDPAMRVSCDLTKDTQCFIAAEPTNCRCVCPCDRCGGVGYWECDLIAYVCDGGIDLSSHD